MHAPDDLRMRDYFEAMKTCTFQTAIFKNQTWFYRRPSVPAWCVWFSETVCCQVYFINAVTISRVIINKSKYAECLGADLAAIFLDADIAAIFLHLRQTLVEWRSTLPLKLSCGSFVVSNSCPERKHVFLLDCFCLFVYCYAGCCLKLNCFLWSSILFSFNSLWAMYTFLFLVAPLYFA